MLADADAAALPDVQADVLTVQADAVEDEEMRLFRLGRLNR